jgi:hypothetical protein
MTNAVNIAQLNVNGDTGALRLPTGTAGQRPTAANGLLRYNSAANVLEFYNGGNSAWTGVGVLDGSSSVNASPGAASLQATLIAFTGTAASGVYWLKPAGSPNAFQAYVDFDTPNGPWVHVGTAAGNTRTLWTYSTTWYSRTTDSGASTNPYAYTVSNFNAGAFIYVKGSLIMIKYAPSGTVTGYVQANGFSNESWRDVYSFLGTLSGWPSQPNYRRELTITLRNGAVSAYNTTGAGLLYGTDATASTPTTYSHWYVYGMDNGGDTFAYLTTGTYGNTGLYSEADHGIGALEIGPAEQAFPGDANAGAANSFDAGTNDVADSGNNGTYDNISFSMWIKNTA